MSIRERIDDSKLLFAAGRLDGALTSVLIAVAATSKKRYPVTTGKSDSAAFKQFLVDERKLITGGSELRIEHRGKYWTLEELLYKLVRCELIHEAELCDTVSFDWGDFLLDKRGTTDMIVFSSELVLRLAYIVENAKENIGVFPTNRFDGLPPPHRLIRSLYVHFMYGEQSHEMICTSASLVSLVPEDATEEIIWLHCVAVQSWNGKLLEPHQAGMRMLVPTQYIVTAVPDREFLIAKARQSADVGYFAPDKNSPPNPIDGELIRSALSSLQIPLIRQTVVLERPA